MKRLLVIGFCLAAPLGCSGKTATSPNPVVGSHSLDGTYVITSTHDPSGAPGGFQPQLRDQVELLVTAGAEGHYRINREHNGTTFDAEDRGELLVASNAVATIDPKGASSINAGLIGLTVRKLKWDLTTGIYQEVEERTTNLPGGGLDYAFIDGRMDGISDGTRQWLHYHADTNYPWDFRHGDACLLGGGATTDGFLGVAYGATHDELRVYLQGVGCEITATRDRSGVFTADGAECSLDPELSIAVLGIASWKYESFALDLAKKHLSFVARTTRTRDDGQVVDLCLKVDSDLTGDVPP